MLTALLLLAASPANAWTHVGYVWLPEDLPRTWYMDDDVEDSLPEGYPLEVLQEGWAGWEGEDNACAGLSSSYQYTSDFGAPDRNDGRTILYWDDPGDDLDVGVLGLTVFPTAGDIVDVNGVDYRHFRDTDIIFNNDVDWGTHDDIVNGVCSGETSIEGVATHEIGHSWGMGHSCEQGDACGDTVLRSATMYWSVGSCDISQDDINEDDIAGISAIYGPYGSLVVTGDRYGGVPHTVDFEAVSEDNIVGVEWRFGDGETSTENPVSHTYTTSGQYTVKLDLQVTSPQCGDQTVEYKTTSLGLVVTCEPPAPEEGASGFFEIKRTDGLTYQTVNHVDASVYGCIDTIQWEVYHGSSEADISEANLVDFNGDGTVDSFGAWAPEIRFPEAGSYVVVMNVGGPGGLDANFLVVEASEGGGGCATVPFGAAGVGALLLAGVGAVRRRRS